MCIGESPVMHKNLILSSEIIKLCVARFIDASKIVESHINRLIL